MNKIDFSKITVDSDFTSEVMTKVIDFRNFKQGMETLALHLSEKYDSIVFDNDEVNLENLNKVVSLAHFTHRYLSIYHKINHKLTDQQLTDISEYDVVFHNLYHSFIDNPKLKKCLKDGEPNDYRTLAWLNFSSPNRISKNKIDLYESHFDKISNFVSEYDQNSTGIMENTDNYIYLSNRSTNLIKGLSQDMLEMGKDSAKAKGKDGYLYYLDEYSVKTILETADSEDLRKQVYYKFLNESSERKSNIKVLSKILKYKKLLAKLLGKKSYVDLVSENHVIDNSKGVLDFINNSKEDYKPVFDIMRNKMLAMANSNKINPWDYLYYYAKDQKLTTDNDPSKNYYEYSNVVNKIIQKLANEFDITIKKVNELESGSVYLVEDESLGKKSYLLLNRFSPNESNAYQIDLVKQDNVSQEFTGAHLVQLQYANNKGNNCLLTYSDVVIILHELGHFFHSFYNNGDFAYEPSKLNLDLVELPSQYLEQKRFEYEFMSSISSHYLTGKKIPKTVFDYVASEYEVFEDCHNYIQLVKQELVNKLYEQGFANSKDREFIINSMLKHNTLYDISEDMFLSYNDHNFDYGPIGYIYDYSARVAKELYANKNVSIKDRFVKTFNKNSEFLKLGAEVIVNSSFDKTPGISISNKIKIK